MGTRSDFYVRNEKSEPKMKWLGSKAWDGHPDSIEKKVLEATAEDEYIKEVEQFLKSEEDATFPSEGWPWPWNDSRTTDYSYIFENGKVMASCFGYPLFDPLVSSEEEREEEEREEEESKMEGYFPDMKAIKNVQLDGRSGLMIITGN